MKSAAEQEWPERVAAELARLEVRFVPDGGESARHASAARLLRRWQNFGPEFGSHPSMFLEDYLAFLWVRDKLDWYVRNSSPPTSEYLLSRLSDTDDAFRASTVTADPGLAEHFWTDLGSGQPGWWWLRTPRDNIGAGMRADFPAYAG